MKDSHGREIDYLRISITDKCNLRCLYCMPQNSSGERFYSETLSINDILKIVKCGEKIGIRKVRYTGGEPLIVNELDRLIYETNKLPGIQDISITTNGSLLYEVAEDLKKSGLRRINISLDTLDRNKYRKITGVDCFESVIKSIEKCVQIGFNPVKINTVLMKGINDKEVGDFIKLTRDLPVEVRFIELMPIGQGIDIYKNTKLELTNLIKNNKELVENDVEYNGVAKMYKVKNAKGRIGIISPVSCKFCNNCNKIRIIANGKLKQCLYSKEDISLKSSLDDEAELIRLLRNAVYEKPFQHRFDKESSKSDSLMYQIGG